MKVRCLIHVARCIPSERHVHSNRVTLFLRFNYLHNLSQLNGTPFMLAGPSGCGKSFTITSKISKESQTRRWYGFTALANSTTKELTVSLLCYWSISEKYNG